MVSSESEQKKNLETKVNFIIFPRFFLTFLISIFLTISLLLTYLVMNDGKINFQEIVLDLPLLILTLIIDFILSFLLVWIWFNPIEIVYERNTKSKFVRKTVFKKNLAVFDNSNPLRVIIFGESEPVIVKNIKPLTSWKELYTTLKSLGILSLTHLDSKEMTTLNQYRELYKKQPKLPKLLVFLDNNNKQVLPPIGNILESGIWNDLQNENDFKERIPLKMEFREVNSSLRSYWGYWIFAQLNWELNLRNDIGDLKALN